MSIFYESPIEDEILDQSDITDISEGHHDDDDDDDKSDERRRPTPLNVLHKQRQEERKRQEEREQQRKRFSGAISGSSALKPCYEFSSIFY